MESILAAFTVISVLPTTAPPAEVARIETVPRFLAVARPLTVIEATDCCEELQVTEFVTSCVVPSSNVPVALNCWATPRGMDLFAGVTVIAVRCAALTIKLAELERVPDDAVITAEPAAIE